MKSIFVAIASVLSAVLVASCGTVSGTSMVIVTRDGPQTLPAHAALIEDNMYVGVLGAQITKQDAKYKYLSVDTYVGTDFGVTKGMGILKNLVVGGEFDYYFVVECDGESYKPAKRRIDMRGSSSQPIKYGEATARRTIPGGESRRFTTTYKLPLTADEKSAAIRYLRPGSTLKSDFVALRSFFEREGEKEPKRKLAG